MHLQLFLLTLLPLAFAQTTTSSAATSTSTAVVDWSALPSCATSCGPLYDAQGACTPPAVSASNLQTYDTCFCAYSTLQPFLSGTTGVCDNACTSDSTGLSSVRSWFLNLCGDATSTSSSATSNPTSTATASPEAKKFVNHNSGSAWVTYHWRWIIMVVILVVAVIGIWVGGCILRKRYIKKREKEYELTNPVPIGPDGKPNYAAAYPPTAAEDGKIPPTDVAPGMKEKKGKGKAKWIVNERT